MKYYNNLEAYIAGQRALLDQLLTANLPEVGVILKVLLPDQRKRGDIANYSVTREADFLAVDCLGVMSDRHRELYVNTTARETDVYPKRTKIRGHRHIFVVSLYDCKLLSDRLGVPVTPELLGANVVVGREDGADYSLSALPAETALLIASEKAISIPRPPLASFIRHAVQEGCGVTGHTIAEVYGNKGLTKNFKDCSKNNRGIVCRIDYPTPLDGPAIILPGQRVFFLYPTGIAP